MAQAGRKTSFCSLKRRLLLSFLCILPLCLLNGWTSNFEGLTAVKPLGDRRGGRNVTVLLWYWPFNRSFSLKGDVCWDLYRIPRCRLVDRRSFFHSADVVVFHDKELAHRYQELPFDLPRPPGQRWAWMSLEAPENDGNLRGLANIFNLTISYRRDADVFVPYGERLLKEPEGHHEEDGPLNKTSLVCWVVSKYKRRYKRSRVYKELKATVPVKVYGRWKRTPLPSAALLPTISRCYFYLAFENSLAKDYITEKLWRNSYLGGAVPVVLGAPLSDYNAVAPPKSFIHVDEFTSIRELGEYLQEIAGDKKRYMEYFTWKLRWKVRLIDDWRERLCRVCAQYNHLPQHKVYTDLEAWVHSNHT